MTYGYDEAVAIPMVQMYDTDMMKMYLSAAKDEYERALADQEKFAKEFGDLYSSNNDLNQAYYDATKGRVNQAMEKLYQDGIDPIRSAEGRAYIQKIIRETPYSKIAGWRSDAENIRTYDKMKAQMIAEGKYDPGYEEYSLKQAGLDNWNPNSDRRWDRLSPVEYKDMASRVKPYSDSIEDGLLSKEDVSALGYNYNPQYDYLGKSQSEIQKQSGLAAQAFSQTPQGRYELQRIKDQMANAGTPINDAQAMQIYTDQVRSNMTVRPRIKARDLDKMAQMQKEHQYQVSMEDLRSQHNKEEYAYKAKVDKYYAASGAGSVSGSGKGRSGNGKSKGTTWNIFDEMDADPGVTKKIPVRQSPEEQGVVEYDPELDVVETYDSEDKSYTRSISPRGIKNMKDFVAYGGFTTKRTSNGSPKKYEPDSSDYSEDGIFNATSKNTYSKDKRSGKYYELFENDNSKKLFWVPIHKGKIGESKNSDNR